MEQIERHLLMTLFLLKKNHYNCIPAIDIDSVINIDNKRVYPQAYLEQCKYKLRKRRVDEELFSENDSNEESRL